MRKYLFLTGFMAYCSILGTSVADTVPQSCFATNNPGEVSFDYTVYFKHDFPKSVDRGGHQWCNIGLRQNDNSYETGDFVNADGCCGETQLCNVNGKNMCCPQGYDKYEPAWSDLATDLEQNRGGDCGKRLYEALQAIPADGDVRILLVATADKTGRDAYNRDLAERRLWTVKQLFTPAQQEKIMVINGGESNDNFTKTNGRNVEERTVRIFVANNQKIEQIVQKISSAAHVDKKQFITLVKGNAQTSAQRIHSIVNNLKGLTGNLDTSVWKNKDGNFNTARLASDSIAGVVLGTAGGLITSNVIKKNQIKGGFEDIKCTVGGQVVAEYGDEFMVGMR